MQCGAAGASYKEMTVVYSWLWTLDNVDIKFWRKDVTALLTDTVNLEKEKKEPHVIRAAIVKASMIRVRPSVLLQDYRTLASAEAKLAHAL